jgi:UDP-glucuronate decarboxylase
MNNLKMKNKSLNNINILDDDLKYIHQNFDKKILFKNKSILITGYLGFIGFELTNYLIKYFKQLGLKNLYLLDNKANKKKISNRNIHLITKDITKVKLENLFKKKKVDIIIHAASIASPTFYRKYPIETIESNIFGLNNILKFARNNKVKRILYFSSSEIYGDPDLKNIPTKEDYNGNVSSIGPRACYDEAKRMGETLCYVYNKKYNIPVRIVRPFNNYGPGLSRLDKRLPADIANNILKNKNIQIFSNGSPTRSFCYISDAVVGYLKVIAYKKFAIFNIGNDQEETSVKELTQAYIKVAEQLYNYDKKIIYSKNKEKDYLTNNPNRRLPNLAHARNEIKYNPKIKLEEGVKRYLQFLKDNQ